jgi:hypothetical protein
MSTSGKKRTVRDGLFQNRWARDIAGVLTTQVLCQFLHVWQLLCDVDLNPFSSESLHVEVVSGWEVLRIIDLPRFLRRLDVATRGQGTLEDEGATQSKVLLVSPAP